MPCNLRPTCARLSAWRSGLGGARSIVFRPPPARCDASLRCPPPAAPPLTSVDSSCDLRPATCDLQPAILTGVSYTGQSGVGSSPSSVPLPRMMFACDALRPPQSAATPLAPPPSPAAPPNPPVPWPPPLSVVHGRLVSSPPSCASCQVTAWVSSWAGSAGSACERRAGRLWAAPLVSTHEVIMRKS